VASRTAYSGCDSAQRISFSMLPSQLPKFEPFFSP